MRLEANVIVARPVEDVWAYLGDVSNVPAWDRGVAATEVRSSNPLGVGFEFDTLARHSRKAAVGGWGKMSYRVTESDPARGCTVQLISTSGNARYFKSAEWCFRVEKVSDGSRVFCAAQFKLRWRYIVLAPVLYATKRAIRTDLESLKQRLEEAGPQSDAPIPD